MILISKVKMLITALFSDPNTVGQGYFIPSVYSKYNVKYETQGKIQKFRPYIDSCAVGGITVKTYPNQNVPKSKCTLVESKFAQVRSKLTQVESKRTHCVVKMYP